MTRPAPQWLADFQRRFGAAIRTPLARSTGTLTAMPAAYDEALLRGTTDGPTATRAERLAVYNRQYWFRFFSVFQDAFPLTMRLLGAWDFNDHVAHFLEATPPRGWDIARVTDGFVEFLESAITDCEEIERVLLSEAARIDQAWQRVFLAPPAPTFRPSEADAPNLLDARLVLSPAVAILEEHAPLSDLRRRVLDQHGEARIPFPPPHPAPHGFAIIRRDAGTLTLPLESREAELLRLVTTCSIRDALARLEASSSEEERAALPAQARQWLARSVENDFWIGLDQSQTTQL